MLKQLPLSSRPSGRGGQLLSLTGHSHRLSGSVFVAWWLLPLPYSKPTIMSGLTDPIVLASLIAAVPATIGAVLSYLANRRSKQTVGLANDNAGKLDRLGNGMMDSKIRNAVREVLEERGQAVTEAFIADLFGRILDRHLDNGE